MGVNGCRNLAMALLHHAPVQRPDQSQRALTLTSMSFCSMPPRHSVFHSTRGERNYSVTKKWGNKETWVMAVGRQGEGQPEG